MSTRKQREMIRLKRMEFDRRVAENRGETKKFVEEKVSTDKGYGLLEDMTKQELIAYAYETGIEVDKYAKKADILSTIKRAKE